MAADSTSDRSGTEQLFVDVEDSREIGPAEAEELLRECVALTHTRIDSALYPVFEQLAAAADEVDPARTLLADARPSGLDRAVARAVQGTRGTFVSRFRASFDEMFQRRRAGKPRPGRSAPARIRWRSSPTKLTRPRWRSRPPCRRCARRRWRRPSRSISGSACCCASRRCVPARSIILSAMTTSATRSARSRARCGRTKACGGRSWSGSWSESHPRSRRSIASSTCCCRTATSCRRCGRARARSPAVHRCTSREAARSSIGWSSCWAVPARFRIKRPREPFARFRQQRRSPLKRRWRKPPSPGRGPRRVALTALRSAKNGSLSRGRSPGARSRRPFRAFSADRRFPPACRSWPPSTATSFVAARRASCVPCSAHSKPGAGLRSIAPPSTSSPACSTTCLTIATCPTPPRR